MMSNKEQNIKIAIIVQTLLSVAGQKWAVVIWTAQYSKQTTFTPANEVTS